MAHLSTAHETIGSDILAVLQTMKYPEQILGAEWLARLRLVEPEGWYPVSTLLELLQKLASKGGHASVCRWAASSFATRTRSA